MYVFYHQIRNFFLAFKERERHNPSGRGHFQVHGIRMRPFAAGPRVLVFLPSESVPRGSPAVSTPCSDGLFSAGTAWRLFRARDQRWAHPACPGSQAVRVPAYPGPFARQPRATGRRPPSPLSTCFLNSSGLGINYQLVGAYKGFHGAGHSDHAHHSCTPVLLYKSSPNSRNCCTSSGLQTDVLKIKAEPDSGRGRGGGDQNSLLSFRLAASTPGHDRGAGLGMSKLPGSVFGLGTFGSTTRPQLGSRCG